MERPGAQSLDNQILVYQCGDRFKLNKKKHFVGHTVAGYACQIGECTATAATAATADAAAVFAAAAAAALSIPYHIWMQCNSPD